MKKIGLFTILVLLGIIIIAFSLHGCRNDKKNKNEEINLVVNKKPAIKAIESFHTSKHIGINGRISEQWKKSDSLYANVSTKELIDLAANHDDKIERLVAFRALLMKNPHEAVNLAISVIDDTTNVSTTDGCCGEENIVSNVRIRMIQYERKQYKVSLADSMRIDSALLFSNNSPKFDYMYHLYHKLQAKPEYEKRLFQLYEQDQNALIALARYHRDDIKQEIIRLISQIDKKINLANRDTICTVLDAVIAWPSESYKQIVRQKCQYILNKADTYGCERSALGALMAYNDKWSYNFIDKTLSKAKQEEFYSTSLDFLKAYEDNPLPLFKPLIQKYKIAWD